MTEFIAGLMDVFADAPLTGTPLAVLQNSDGLSDEQMRRTAGEFNQAETTFILQSTRADWKLRSFTASGVEVSGAGHNPASLLQASRSPILSLPAQNHPTFSLGHYLLIGVSHHAN